MSSAANGASRASTPPSTSSVNAEGRRSHQKMTSIGGKPLDGQRKQASSPMDQPPRKPSVPNAWAKGSTNPVTQRPVGAMTSNGIPNNQNKPSNPQKVPVSTPKESNTPDRHANDRLTFLYAKFIGLPATISLRTGDKYTGIFSSVVYEQSDAKYLMKMVKKLGQSEKQVNGAADPIGTYVGTGQDHVMTFLLRDAVLNCDNVPAELPKAKSGQNGTSVFKTDTDISNSQGSRERQLQKWDAAADTDVNLSLEGDSKANGQNWDQFEANERLYGLTSNYDEAFYTTTIDKSHPEYKQREARAERIAREIEGSAAMNSHVAEERGLKLPDDHQEDEESKYSGVRRDVQSSPAGQTNKYTPPARRPPTGQTTVTGAPVDPAIISASLAKPEKPELPPKENEAPKANPVASKSSKSQEETKAESSKSQLSALTAKPALPAAKLSPNKEGGATATVEKDVVNAFKRFTADEKLKAQEHQRNAIKRDKAVKLNDLKKFAQNFKLHTPVPTDLVPILAKDKNKQEKIVEKALKHVHEYKTTPPKVLATPSPAPSSTQATPRPTAPRGESNQTPSSNQTERTNQRNRQGQSGFQQSSRNNAGAGDRATQPIPTVARQSQPPFNQRLQQQYAGRQQVPPIAHNVPDPRMPPMGPAMASGVHSPPGRVHYNAKMPEFKPNPAAHTFQPGTNNSSSSSPVRASPAKPEQPKRGNFFKDRRGITASEDRPSISLGFNPVARVLKEAKDEGKQKDFVSNGGIPQAYRTPPTWDVPESNKDTKYTQIFDKERTPSVSQPPNIMPHQQIPHQHQLPMHLQSGGGPMPTGHTPHHTPRHAPVQPHMGPNGHHYDDHHRMQFSASTSSMHPSPRTAAPYMSFNGQTPQQMQMHPQQMANYGMSPGGYPIMRQVSSGGPQYMTGPQMGGHMMTNQSSQGPYMNMQMNNQMPMFSPGPNQAYPHHSAPPMPQQGVGSSFPSPRPPAQMMAQQGSQQGHHAQMMYMPPGQHGQYPQPPSGPMGPMRPYAPQGPYGTSPHQPHHFPHNPHRGTPSATYVQPMMPAHSMPPQGMPPNGGPPIASESQDDVK